MLKACVQLVQKGWIAGGKKCVRLSTNVAHRLHHTYSIGVKPQLIPHLRTRITTWFSTAKIAGLNLLNTHLYPLSTAPIIITTKEIY